MASQRSKILHHIFCRFDNTVLSHHSDCECFLTLAIRLWDVESKRKQKTVIVVKSKERGARTKVTSCTYSPDGNIIAGGLSLPYSLADSVRSCILACLDGALHLWQTSSNFVRPNMTVESAHAKGVETGSVVFSVDGRTVLTRSGDDTVKRESQTVSGLRGFLTRRSSLGYTGV
jgi:WD40 repeat protein